MKLERSVYEVSFRFLDLAYRQDHFGISFRQKEYQRCQCLYGSSEPNLFNYLTD